MATTTTTSQNKDAARKELQATLGELETLRDEIRVRLHLAGMDIKKAWGDLDPEYLRLRDAARDVRDEAVVALRDALVEVRKGLRAVRKELEKK